MPPPPATAAVILSGYLVRRLALAVMLAARGAHGLAMDGGHESSALRPIDDVHELIENTSSALRPFEGAHELNKQQACLTSDGHNEASSSRPQSRRRSRSQTGSRQ